MSYKKKNIFLVIGIVLLAIITYSLSISKTIDYKHKLKALQKEKDGIENISTQLVTLKKESIDLDTILAKENISVTNSFQQILLKKINEYKSKNPIDIVEFNNPISVKENGANVLLYPFIIRGNFNSLLSFLNFIEQQGLGEIKNFKFIKKKNFARKREFLLLEIYIKKIVTES